MRVGVVAIVGMALAGLAPGAAHAQASSTFYGGVYTNSPLNQIERGQRGQLDANRAIIGSQNDGRYQQQLDLERQTLEEARRQREGYLFQSNTSQRAIETQLREEALRLRTQDQESRQREIKQLLEEENLAAQAKEDATGIGRLQSGQKR
jgi:hypothetical protein